MFGIGMQEMVVVGLLFLVVFGPRKLPEVARDLGRFANEARRWVEEFKGDLLSEKEGSQGPPGGQRELGDDVGLEKVPEREEDALIRPEASRGDRL